MGHELPAMLSNRVFPVLVVTATTGRMAFVVVQIPVDISSLAVAMYSNGRNLHEGDSKVKRKKSVLGYKCYSDMQMHNQNADIFLVSIQASSDAKSSQT